MQIYFFAWKPLAAKNQKVNKQINSQSQYGNYIDKHIDFSNLYI